MDPVGLLMLGVGAFFIFVLLVGLYAGIRRVQGHRTRFDGLVEMFVRSQSAGVYPPSLRGNPNPLEQEVVEISRGDQAVRSTPGEVEDSDQIK